MSWLYPAFLIGGLAIAIPIVLHLLRRDVAPEVPFTAVRLLRKSPVERSKRRRLRDVLLLATRVLAVLLLAAAFARPYVQAGASAGVRIVAIDRSFSMGAPGRFERAMELARAAIDDSGGADRVAVIAFDERAAVLAEPGTQADAREALAKATLGFSATRYVAAIDEAARLVHGGPGTLVIVTDLQRAGWTGTQPVAMPANLQIEVRQVGEPSANVAVTALRREQDRLVATVRNAGPSVYQGNVRADVDGRRLAEAPVRAGAGSTVEIPLSVKLPAAGGLAISIDDAAGFAADNARYAVLDSGQTRVLIVTPPGQGRKPGYYLSRALQSSAGEEGGFDPVVVSGSAVSAMAADRLAEHAAVILLSTRGLDRRARENLAAHVRKGGGLFVAAAPDLEPQVLSTVFGWRPPLAAIEADERLLTLAATDLRHPIFRPFGALAANLGQVRFDRTWRVRPEGWQVAARFSDGTPALLDRAEGAGRVVVFTSDLDRRWNDFPLHPSFVPFVLESLSYVSPGSRRLRDYTVASAPEGAGPGPGVYRVDGGRAVAVNVDVGESQPDRMSIEQFNEMIRPVEPQPVSAATALQARQTEAQQSYWRYGLLLMLGMLVAESLVGRAT